MTATEYQCIVSIPDTGEKWIAYLKSESMGTAEQARDFGEAMMRVGMAIGYRVMYRREENGTWYHHEYVHYAPRLPNWPSLVTVVCGQSPAS